MRGVLFSRPVPAGAPDNLLGGLASPGEVAVEAALGGHVLAEEPQHAHRADQVRLSPPVAVQAQHVGTEGLQIGVAYLGKVVEPLLIQSDRTRMSMTQ